MTRRLAIQTEIFRGFPKFVSADLDIVPQLDHSHPLRCPSQLVIHQLSFDAT